MNEPIRVVETRPGTRGEIEVLSPGVGWWSDHPSPGAIVGPGSRVGRMTVLNQRSTLILPAGAAGRAQNSMPGERAVAVEYGQVLFVLSPFIAGEDVAIGPGVPGGAASRSDLPEGARAIVSPTDGFFYRRPSPDAEPFVEIGARVRPGQPLGLVEVMKTFNQILYGGPGLPDEAEILEFRAGDGAEVHAGQVLIVVR